MTRLYGRIVGGFRLHESTPGAHWNTTSIISSIRIDGKTECMTIEGATDADVFRTYIDHILCPTLRQNDVVIMDNLSSHKVSGIKESIESTGAILLYLPPYSPDLNPIEKMWSKMKAQIRKVKPRTSEETENAVASALKNVSSADAKGWFASCGYVLIHS
jgi:transposase